LFNLVVISRFIAGFFMEREQFIKRDTRLKEFAIKWKPGVDVEEELQTDFLTYCGQVASRKCFRMNIKDDRLDDVVAEVQFKFLVAIALGKYVVTDAPVAGYVSTITQNEIINAGKKQRSKSNWVERYVEEFKIKSVNRNPRPVEEEVIEAEALSEIFEAIAELTPEQQEPVLLLAKGASHDEICQELQITDNALRNRIFRARKTLRDALDTNLSCA
jgi:RNA polymerase sigma factor (sigma-70 family)